MHKNKPQNRWHQQLLRGEINVKTYIARIMRLVDLQLAAGRKR